MDRGVTAFRDRISLRNIYNNYDDFFNGVPSKGIANSHSPIPNDGADFGPDTLRTASTGLGKIFHEYINLLTLGNTSIKEVCIIGEPLYITQPVVPVYQVEFPLFQFKAHLQCVHTFGAVSASHLPTHTLAQSTSLLLA